MTEEYTYHFDEERKSGAVNCNRSTYKRLNEEYFPELKPYLDQEGVEVYNCNPQSGLKVFPYKPYEECVAEAIAPLGDIANERTYGMYSKPGTKDEVRIEPTLQEKKNAACLRELPPETATIQATDNSPIQVEVVEVPRNDMFDATAPSPFADQPMEAPLPPSPDELLRVAQDDLLQIAQQQQAQEQARKAAKKAKKEAQKATEASNAAQPQKQVDIQMTKLEEQELAQRVQMQQVLPKPQVPVIPKVQVHKKSSSSENPIAVPERPRKPKPDQTSDNVTTSHSLLRKPLE